MGDAVRRTQIGENQLAYHGEDVAEDGPPFNPGESVVESLPYGGPVDFLDGFPDDAPQSSEQVV